MILVKYQNNGLAIINPMLSSWKGWEDPEYSKCYTSILQGDWEKYDAFDATHRVNANMDMYNCSGI